MSLGHQALLDRPTDLGLRLDAQVCVCVRGCVCVCADDIGKGRIEKVGKCTKLPVLKLGVPFWESR